MRNIEGREQTGRKKHELLKTEKYHMKVSREFTWKEKLPQSLTYSYLTNNCIWAAPWHWLSLRYFSVRRYTLSPLVFLSLLILLGVGLLVKEERDLLFCIYVWGLTGNTFCIRVLFDKQHQNSSTENKAFAWWLRWHTPAFSARMPPEKFCGTMLGFDYKPWETRPWLCLV